MSTEPRGLLFDASRCIGCGACVNTCMKEHGFPGDSKTTDDLSATAYTALVTDGESNVRKMCRHCLHPSCVSVCPVGALRKDELGPVTYDADKCIGCRYCMVACPFNVPRYEWTSRVPAVRKCDGCIDRLKKDELPFCAEACRYEATVSGTRKDLLAEARKRIAEDPDMYADHIWGENEIGGTSVLFLAPKDMPALGFPKVLGTEPLPERSRQQLRRIPGVVTIGGAALFAFWWITRRRDEVAKAERKEGGHV